MKAVEILDIFKCDVQMFLIHCKTVFEMATNLFLFKLIFLITCLT